MKGKRNEYLQVYLPPITNKRILTNFNSIDKERQRNSRSIDLSLNESDL